jgi:hypothetical protein
VVGNGKNVLFWDDVWLFDVRLRIIFPKVYAICFEKKTSISRCLADGEPDLSFSRTFDQTSMAEWEEMCVALQGVVLNGDQDKVLWALEKSNSFTSKSM